MFITVSGDLKQTPSNNQIFLDCKIVQNVTIFYAIITVSGDL